MALSETRAALSRLFTKSSLVKNRINDASFVFSRILTPLAANQRFLHKDNTVPINQIQNELKLNPDQVSTKKKMSKAMKAYFLRTKQFDEFMKKEVAEYQIGKRHLANMMGEDPETFTQNDVDRAIEYLFPSALFEPPARPMMKPPEQVFPAQRETQFDETGRPIHFLFYTQTPIYYQGLYDLVEEIEKLNKHEDSMIRKGNQPLPEDMFNPGAYKWISKADLEKKTLEKIRDKQYVYLIDSLIKLTEHPYSAKSKEFLKKFMTPMEIQSNDTKSLPQHVDENGRPYVTVDFCPRRSARAVVTVRGFGSGKITINDKDITYFNLVQSREQVRLFNMVITYFKQEMCSP